MEYLISFDPEKCTQCLGCETACKLWRNLPYGIRYRRVLNLWDGAYPDVKSTGFSLACLHCATPACMAACPADAIFRNAEDGRVLVDTERCTGCRTCARACPFGVPQFGEDKTMQKCDLCASHAAAGFDPPCVSTCPGQALVFEAVTPAEKKARETMTVKMLKKYGIMRKAKTPKVKSFVSSLRG